MRLSAVLRQPGEPPGLVAQRPEVWLLAVPGVQPQTKAQVRTLARQALRRLLSQCLGVAPQQVALVFVPGQAPTVADRWQGLALSISIGYAPGVVAIGLCAGGRLGIDLAVVQPLPDWEPLARLYLGDRVAQQLAEVAGGQRDQDFARAWAAMEARSKCLGLGLQEWSPARELHLNAAVLEQLPVPPDALPVGAPPCVLALACSAPHPGAGG